MLLGTHQISPFSLFFPTDQRFKWNTTIVIEEHLEFCYVKVAWKGQIPKD